MLYSYIPRWLFLVFSVIQAVATYATVPANTFPIELVNNSAIATDDEVYIVIKGENPSTKKAVFAQINPTTGIATVVQVNASTNANLYNYKLSELPLIGGKRTLYLPYLASVRIYFSIQYPMDLHVALDNTGAYTIPDPSPFDPTDSNYYTLYDKIECTFDAVTGTYSNPTAVDFFSLPLQLEQSGSTSAFTISGFTDSRANIISVVQGQFTDTLSSVTSATQPNWGRLFVNYTDPSGTSALLRLMSPGKAILPDNNDAPYFDNSYLKNMGTYGFDYIDAVNAYYMVNTVGINCTELTGVFNMTGGSGYILNGQMTGPDGNGNYLFHFDNGVGGSYSFDLQMPTDSFPFFAGAGESFNAVHNTPPSIIVRQLTSAFDVGLLPAPNGTVLDKDYFKTNKLNYYTNNTLLNAGSTQPWYDLYSKALHSIGDLIYTFAYDDALDQDGTLHDPSPTAPTALVVTLGNMNGTNIPDPFFDPSAYTVTALIGDGSVVYYKGVLVKNNQPLKNVSSPFVCQLNGETANIFLHDGFVRPYFNGASAILVQHTGLNAVNVIFPGNKSFPMATPTPIPTPTPTIKPPPAGLPTPSPTPTPLPVPTAVPSGLRIAWEKNSDGTYSGMVTLPDGRVKSFSRLSLPAVAIYAPEDVRKSIEQEADTILNGL